MTHTVTSACPHGNHFNVFLGSERVASVEKSNQPGGLVMWRDHAGPSCYVHADGTVERFGDQSAIEACRDAQVLEEAPR